MNERLLKILGGEEKFYPRELESKYPRIFEKIMFLWDKPGMDHYFMGLMVQEREGRAGFPLVIAAEIMRLSLVHASSHSPNKKYDIWEVSTDKFANFKPPVPIGNAAFWRQAIGVRRTRLERAGFFGGHCKVCDHAPILPAP